MRARHRHFNPRDAGASVVYDSRRISGLSNNDPVSTWPDISRNNYNATQTGTARPTFKTAQQGGNPTLNFDGSNDNLEIPLGPALNTAQGHFVSSVAKYDSTAAIYPVLFSVKTNFANNYILFFGASGDSAYRWPSIGSDSNFARLRWDSATNGNNNIWTLTYNGAGSLTNGNYKLFFNSDEKPLTASGSYGSVTGTARLGAYLTSPSGFLKGDIYNFTIIQNEISNSLRKRCDHASAYSFKIACS